MSIIRIKNTLYNELVAYAKEHLPEEACGIVAGKIEGDEKLIEKVYFLENVDHAENHFTMNPKDQLATIKDIRANGMVQIGNWHSHPSSPSRPSVEDIRLSYDSKASYLILSFMADAPVINSFHVENGEYSKEDLRIYNDEYWF